MVSSASLLFGLAVFVVFYKLKLVKIDRTLFCALTSNRCTVLYCVVKYE